MIDPDRLLSIKEAAAELGVHPETVRRWIREGSIPVERYGPHGMVRIRAGALAHDARAPVSR